MRFAAERNRFADHVRISREASFPKAETYYNDLLAIRKVLFAAECLAANNRRFEEFEIIRGYLLLRISLAHCPSYRCGCLHYLPNLGGTEYPRPMVYQDRGK